jgi:hypothetical protein
MIENNRFALAVMLAATLLLSCSRNREVHTHVTPSHKTVVPEPEIGSSVLDSLTVSGDPVMLSPQTLTSFEHVLNSFGSDDDPEFLYEGTSPHAAFFAPEKGVRDDDLMRKVRDRYNVVAVMNRVNHAYEWFKRISTYSDDEDTTMTYRDTVKWALISRPDVSPSFLTRVLSPGDHRVATTNLLLAYNSFDGDDGPESKLTKAFDWAVKAFKELPAFATKEMLDKFKEGFWDWYDKRRFVPEIDDIIKLHLNGYEGEDPSEEQIARLKRAVECERDIDRRTILALELVKFDLEEGSLLLGDILESGIYTRYLAEAWISWRANTQMVFSASSFSVIPNNYFDMMRVRCMNTILKHCQEEEDDNALCLLENLLEIDLLHRMGSLLGNESLATCAALSYNEFIDQRLLDEDE